MTLPNIEKTPVILLRFTAAASDRLIALVKERLRQGGLLVLQQGQQADSAILRLTTSQQALEEQAERIHLLKRTLDDNVVEQ